METIILFAPLVGAILGGFGWRVIGEKGAMVLTTGLLFLACALSWIVFLTIGETTQHIHVLNWITSGDLDVSWSIRMDRLTAIMLIVVTTVSALVHLYSWGYMAHDENWTEKENYKARFFAYLSFFTFTMLMLVTSDNLLQMFFGWEGVGVASYLLIGFYYKKPSANAAAMKAFIVNRVGDFGFLLGMFGLFYMTGSLKMDDVFAAAPALAETELHFLWTQWNAVELIGFLLFVGAMGKSAQLFLHTWLPDAMEGPTPVSALIHAATMVTAGVFLVCRMSPVYEYAPHAKDFILIIGATTAFFAATVGLVQNDIKRVIAYSTCSQLGYMFAAAGVGVYSASMFHLLTHAFFKALLFLSAGSVITAMHHEQDMRNYGGLRKKVPVTFWAMILGTLAITGVGIPFTHIGFAGFLSKDAIIESVWGGNGAGYAFWLLVIAAVFTSFYSWRLIFMTFFGKERGDHHAHEHAHESPLVMTVPLMVLSVGAVFAGMVWYNAFFGDHTKLLKFFGMPAHEEHMVAEGAGHGAGEEAAGEQAAAGHGAAMTETEAEHAVVEDAKDSPDMGAAAAVLANPGVAPQGAIYLHSENDVLDRAHHAPAWVKLSPFVAMLSGLIVAWLFYIKDTSLPKRAAEAQPALYRFLLNKWYFDELYERIFVRPALWLGYQFWKKGDEGSIDRVIDGMAVGIVPTFTRFLNRMQSGYLFHYAFAMVIGLVVLMFWVVLNGGAN
ncbi:MAG: NADH-quinone oxidoreductase subunit L [Rhodobacteraceae bacterium]|uniref:NADH-quinone oxidoreductase subunit L n=1 Tax=Thioclava marina TaxID=1915077 RepID=A0ABX3MHY6_9RHOB|nr:MULTISPECIES: NADH-quinone oxidoreductase subunit L [Thioclava]OOY11060.1 NADH-quinone oxidoreductase subunit L [Thioclava marina]OOY27165.1 NADH-quinone oxidoreductase subunit L [Thioclava sp. L04-15]TNE92721.1 MAG: NADH-quinone oxidoreductase subunit L [Paracoccaceae bacterium]TNF13478.1 MAG: NADH-quinone oxidoreductase subunit L [Paracoccaceae bacterium]